MGYGPETPFDNIESAQQFVDLLIQAINESRRDVDADMAHGSGRSKKALHLVSANLARLSQHMTTSRRILNHLRTLRRLLLQERQFDNTPQNRNGNRELSRWS